VTLKASGSSTTIFLEEHLVSCPRLLSTVQPWVLLSSTAANYS